MNTIMEMSSTTEDYLKKILAESEASGNALVGLGHLARTLGVTPGTVTTMMKNLAESGLVDYRPREGVSLTDIGRRTALQVLRRHRLLELFLVKTLELDWSEVHDEAEVLEHAVSDRLLARIDDVLGHPAVDPHGDPIPNADLALIDTKGMALCDVEPLADVRVIRVEHEHREFLNFLSGAGLVPGAKLRVVARDASAETLTVLNAGKETALSLNAAGRITVERE